MKKFVLTLFFLLPVFSFAGEWIADRNTNCQVWNANPAPGESIDWSGPCVNGKANGKGVLQWYLNGAPNGRYEGEQRDGLLNGKGIYTWTTGDRYEGEYRDDRRTNGTFTWKNGTRYVGEFRDGARHGFGTLSLVKGDPGIETYGKNGNENGTWKGDTYVAQGLFSNSTFVLACANKATCENQQRLLDEKTPRKFIKGCEGERVVCDQNNGICTTYYFSKPSSEIFVDIKYSGSTEKKENCKKTYTYPVEGKEFSARFFDGKNNTIAKFSGTQLEFGYALDGKIEFTDGEVWNMYRTHEGVWNSVTQNASKSREVNNIQKAIDEKNRKATEDYNNRVASFRSALQAGDDTSSGMVLEIKGNLVKIQINQCIQRDYSGNCQQWGNAEKWFKKSDIYPNK